MAELKLYVWTGVLTDYTDGLVCVLATSEKQAWNLLYEKDDTAWWVLQGSPEPKGIHRSHSLNAYDWLKKNNQFKFPSTLSPEVITKPSAFLVWGGS